MFLDVLNNWLFYYQIWIIIGVIFLFFELIDGSLIICLPLGISAFLISFFVFIIYQTDIKNLHMIQDYQFMPFFKAFLDKYVQTGNSLFDSLELKI